MRGSYDPVCFGGRVRRLRGHIFRVRDYNESNVEKDTMATLVYRQNLREGHFKIQRTTTVNYKNGMWLYERLYKGKQSFHPARSNSERLTFSHLSFIQDFTIGARG